MKNGEICENSFRRNDVNPNDPIIIPDSRDENDDQIFPIRDEYGVRRLAKACDACSCREKCISDYNRFGTGINRHWCPVRKIENPPSDKLNCEYINPRNSLSGVDKITPEIGNWRYCGRDLNLTQTEAGNIENFLKKEQIRYMTALTAYDKLPEELKQRDGIYSKKSYIRFWKIMNLLDFEYWKERMDPEIVDWVLQKNLYQDNSLCSSFGISKLSVGIYYIRNSYNIDKYLGIYQIDDSDEFSLEMRLYDDVNKPNTFIIRKIQKIENDYYFNIIDLERRKYLSLKNNKFIFDNTKTSWLFKFEHSSKDDKKIPYYTCKTSILKYKLPSSQAPNEYIIRNKDNPDLVEMSYAPVDPSDDDKKSFDESKSWEFVQLL